MTVDKVAEVTEEVVETVVVEVTETTETTEPVIEAAEEVTVDPEKTETEKVDVTEYTAQIEALQAELSALKEASETAGKAASTTSEKLEQYEKSLETVVAEKSATISDEVKALMPEGISVTEKLAWLDKAAALNKEVPPVEPAKVVIESIGKPTPITEQVVDTSDQTAFSKMSAYFGTVFK